MADNTSDAAVVMDIDVYVPDIAQGVPGTGMSIWQYRDKVDPNWQIDPETYPGVKQKPLPDRCANLAKEALEDVFKQPTRDREVHEWGPIPTKTPTVQVVGRYHSLDLRFYGQSGKPHGSASSMFLNTVHHCFAEHYALGILPENLMWMVLHEVGVCVKENPETYRDLFTTSAEKELLEVTLNSLEIDRFDQVAEWAEGIALLQEKLRRKMPSDLVDHLLPEFSTHTVETETASMVAVLDAASPYYDYLMRTCCGIPKIRLFGVPEDYQTLYKTCQHLSQVFAEDLGEYFKYLLPVVKEIADTASGAKEPDNDFWASIYNHYSASGRDNMDGWITAFVNYRAYDGIFLPKDPNQFDWRASMDAAKNGDYGKGIHREEIPAHFSTVPFVWEYPKNMDQVSHWDCRLVGGFMAVENRDGFATPVLSFAVLRGEETVKDLDASDKPPVYSPFSLN